MTGAFEYDRFFTTAQRMLELHRERARRNAFSARTAAEASDWARRLRPLLAATLGLDAMAAAPLEARVTERREQEELAVERVEIQTEPGAIMPLSALVPRRFPLPRPAIIAPHGHLSAGKLAVVGRDDIPALAETIRKHNYAYGRALALAGFVVFCPDARGFGERREWMHQGKPEDFLGGSCREINNVAISLGLSLTGMWTWDLMRLIDYIGTRCDCVPGRVGCVGLSGGGLQALWLAAMDERVRAAVVSGYFYGYRDSLLKLNGNCSCNYVPGLWRLVDMGDVGALVAPRPLLIESGDEDGLNGERGIANAVEQVEIAREAYELLGAGERLYHHVFHGPHRWDGARSLPWLARWLGAEA